MKQNHSHFNADGKDEVKSDRKKGKIILISLYLLVWAFAMIAFWRLMDPSDAGGFSLIFIWVLIPALTFIESVIIGVKGYWGKLAWIAVPVFGAGLMLLEFCSFEIANHIAFGNMNTPEPSLFLVGAAISAVGVAVGKVISILHYK